MSTKSTVAIDIVTQLKGAQNLDNAQKKLGSLDSAVGKLGKILATTFATTKIIEFGKASVEAFANDQKAAMLLANTLKNVGQGFKDAGVENFITQTSLATGILKNDLRAGFDTLVRSTKDATEAQNLLNLALDVSAGTGKDLGSVTSALGKAYLGQTTALSRLGVGLTSAQLKGKSFVQIQEQLNGLFKGDAQTAASSYAGEIKRIGAAWEEAKVTIGSGMVDAFTSLTSSNSFTGFIDGMTTAATAIANIIRGVGDIGKAIESLPGAGMLSWVGKLLGWSYKNSALGFLQGLGAKDQQTKADAAAASASTIHTRSAGMVAKSNLAAAKAVTVLTAAQIKALAVAKEQAKLDAASALLKKSQAVFDLQAIEIQAALQNEKLAQDDKVRLQILATNDQLAAAIQDKNMPAVASLSDALTKLLDTFTKIAGLSPFDKATNSVDAFTTGLQKAMDTAYQLSLLTQGINIGSLLDQSSAANAAGNPALGAVYDAQAQSAMADAQAAATDALASADQASTDAIAAAMDAASQAFQDALASLPTLPPSIQVLIDGQALNQSQVNTTANGSASSYIKSGMRDKLGW